MVKTGELRFRPFVFFWMVWAQHHRLRTQDQVKPHLEVKSTVSTIEAVLLSIEMHTVSSRRCANAQTRSF
jgi:hypothetical protein